MSSPRFRLVTLFLLVLLSIQYIPEASSSIAGDNIIITEVLYDAPTSDSTEEWFELFNPTDSTINITGWIMGDNYANITLTGIIPADGFFVVAVDSVGFNALYGYDPDQSGNWGGFALSNSGDMLTLYSDESTEVDFVAWEDEVPGWNVSAVNTSIRRINATDTDTNADWENSDTIGDPGFGSYVTIPEFSMLTMTILGLVGVSAIVAITVFRRKE